MTKAQANKAARNIREYWARHGCKVEVSVHREPWVRGTAGGVSFGIKTNLKNGFPPDFKGKKSEFRP